METIRTLEGPTAEIAATLEALRAPLGLDATGSAASGLAKTVREIIDEVGRRGDAAVAEYSAKFDQVKLTPDRFRVGEGELAAALDGLDPKLRAALELAIENVRAFQAHTMMAEPAPMVSEGVTLVNRLRPLARVGVLVPGASAPLPSAAVMTVVPAQVAGVPEIVLLCPPRYEGRIHPVTLGTAALLGLTEVYQIGGAHGVAALALGTQSIGRVDKIVGPGHPVTQIAKKMLFGKIDIDSFAGASEVLIVADDSADVDAVATDMLAQAEHDPGVAVLVTTSGALAEAIPEALERISGQLARSEQMRRCLATYGAIVVAADMEQAVDVANAFGPEHLHVETREPEAVADRLVNAGAIFLGHTTPEATGDYMAGPSHVLPTGGTARFFGALCANDFLKHTSVIRYEERALRAQAEAIIAIAEAEQLGAHAMSVKVRCR